MSKLRIISWNVNGIRAIDRKEGLAWLRAQSPDIICLQETKAQPEQLDESIRRQPGYTDYWASAERKGYSGVAIFSKSPPLDIRLSGAKNFDSEGRVLVAEYPEFVLINAYFPNSQAEGKRLPYKLAFCEALQQYCNRLRESGKHIVLCGDYNVAHKPIDLANPKNNEKNPGYLPEERAWMDGFIGGGYTDTFRHFNQEPHQYTWWSYRTNARERNIGWRIDYHCVDDAFADALASTTIHADVLGSDHCPVELAIKG